MRHLWLLFFAGCASIVAPGQTREAMQDSGALRWTLTEYDFQGAHFVWIPHWSEGMLHVSTPHATNVESVDVLEFKGDVLAAVESLGVNRVLWAAKLKAHGRIKDHSAKGGQTEADPLHLAVTEKILHVGASLECVLFAAGFPRYGARSSPRCLRAREDIQATDTLYYFVTRGGTAREIVLLGGKISEIRDGEHLSFDWIRSPR